VWNLVSLRYHSNLPHLLLADWWWSCSSRWQSWISDQLWSRYIYSRCVLMLLYLTFDVHCCHMGTAMKHPVPDRVKPSFVIFDIRALWRSALSVRVPGCQN